MGETLLSKGAVLQSGTVVYSQYTCYSGLPIIIGFSDLFYSSFN